MFEIIKSQKNSKVKFLKKMYSSRQRKKAGYFVLEGFRLIEQALLNNAKIEQIFMTPSFYNSSQGEKIISLISESTFLYLLDESLLSQIADTVNPQGVISLVKEVDIDLSYFLKNINKILVLDQVQDPGNMGNLIRTAVAAGIEGIISLKGSVDIYNLKVIRASMGAIFVCPIINKMNLDEFLHICRSEYKEFQLICSTPRAANDYHQTNYNDKFLLVIGNEARGIREKIINMADITVKIPLRGEIESINAASAGSILMYQILNEVYQN